MQITLFIKSYNLYIILHSFFDKSCLGYASVVLSMLIFCLLQMFAVSLVLVGIKLLKAFWIDTHPHKKLLEKFVVKSCAFILERAMLWQLGVKSLALGRKSACVKNTCRKFLILWANSLCWWLFYSEDYNLLCLGPFRCLCG